MDGSVTSGRQLVIVALPSEHDYVRQISSEKEPHLTLLYLGENKFDQTQMDQIEGYVEHATSMLSPFGLDVESRGELGDEHADVLFFNKAWAKHITLFRENLLRNDLISEAYHSTDQFPEWTPHLTMGYPNAPAKKDNREYPHFSYVHFDRIAIWTGDSTGPTIRLKPKDYGVEVAMSQTIDRGRSATSGVLEHYGVKGMKWGVRNADGGGAPSRAVSDDHKTAVAAQRKISSGGTKTLSNKELQTLLTRMNLERQYSTMMGPPQKSKVDKGHDRVKKALGLAKTYDDVKKFLETDTGQMVKNGLKGAFLTAKIAAAAATGGTTAAAGAAATVGAGLVLRRMNR
jgi:2'-5' RNA ligase